MYCVKQEKLNTVIAKMLGYGTAITWLLKQLIVLVAYFVIVYKIPNESALLLSQQHLLPLAYDQALMQLSACGRLSNISLKISLN